MPLYESSLFAHAPGAKVPSPDAACEDQSHGGIRDSAPRVGAGVVGGAHGVDRVRAVPAPNTMTSAPVQTYTAPSRGAMGVPTGLVGRLS
jgi:hypothetical protein